MIRMDSEVTWMDELGMVFMLHIMTRGLADRLGEVMQLGVIDPKYHRIFRGINFKLWDRVESQVAYQIRNDACED